MSYRHFIAATFAFIAALSNSLTARALELQCHPSGVGEDLTDRFLWKGVEVGATAVKCEEREELILYVPTSDGQAAARFTSLALAALLSGRTLRLTYSEHTSTCKQGFECYWLSQWSIWR